MIKGHELVKLLAGIIGKTPDERATMRRQILDSEKVFVVHQVPGEERGAVTIELFDRDDVLKGEDDG